LRRLGQQTRISAHISPQVCVPAPGQGIIAVEIRTGDDDTLAAVARLNEAQASAALAAERAVVTRLGGGCQMPIGAFAAIRGDMMSLAAVVIAPDGSSEARADASGPVSNAPRIGREAAERLLERGAADILAAVERAQAQVEGLQP
jgi:hydroxymethylbilane synthase